MVTMATAMFNATAITVIIIIADIMRRATAGTALMVIMAVIMAVIMVLLIMVVMDMGIRHIQDIIRATIPDTTQDIIHVIQAITEGGIIIATTIATAAARGR
jgi:hypothetical protein